MRAVKYRSWNKVSKEMSYDVVLNGPTFTEVGDEILMQFVGTDIDGADVYEGDLLRFPEDSHLYHVKWDFDEGGFGIYHGHINFAKIGLLRMMQVAGNKYESKEGNTDGQT